MASATAALQSLLLPLLLLFAHCAVADRDSSLEFPTATAAPFPEAGAPSPLEAIAGLSLSSPPSPIADLSPDLPPLHSAAQQTRPVLVPYHSPPASPPAAEPGSSTTIHTPSFDLFQPEDDSDVQFSKTKNENRPDSGSGSGGISGLKKAAIVIAAVAGASLVVMGVLVYKRRQENIRRARFGYVTRNDFL